MAFLVISGFYPEPNPDNSLHYEKTVPPEREKEVLAAMAWAELRRASRRNRPDSRSSWRRDNGAW